MRTPFIVACILLVSMLGVHGQETVDVARDLYTSANYEDALVVLTRLDSTSSQPSDRMAINQYRAFCLLALGRMPEAERAIEAVLTVDPLYRPSDAAISPRLRSAFAGVRQRILPSIVQQEYARAKTAFDREDFPSAIAQFDRVLQALADPDLVAASGNLADLRTLASGFRDLSIKAAAPPPAPPAPTPPPAVAVAAAPVIGGIYGGTEPGVSMPVVVRQSLPPFPGDLIARREGVLELIINEAGEVESAVMRSPVAPRYDSMVLAAAKGWKYSPATLNGTPVKFRKVINISIKSPS
jgi:tetratricopeptide (TPR) repeat protein